jgi:hypothetical protein
LVCSSAPLLQQIDAFDVIVPAEGASAEDHVDGGGLARAVRTQKPDDLARAHVERNTVDRRLVPVRFAQPPDFQDTLQPPRLTSSVEIPWS